MSFYKRETLKLRVIVEVRLYVSVIYCTSQLVLVLITGLHFTIKKSVKRSLIIHHINVAQFLALPSLLLFIPILIFFFFLSQWLPDVGMEAVTPRYPELKCVSLRLKHGLSMFKSC